MSNILISGSTIFFATSSDAFGTVLADGENDVDASIIVTQSHVVAKWEVDDDEDTVVLKSDKDNESGTRLLLKSSRGTDGAIQVGDTAGEIDFVVASSSFTSGKMNTSGSLANIRAEVRSVSTRGVAGRLIFSLGKDATTDAQDLFQYEYSPQSLAEFAQQHTASLLLNDLSSGIRSRIQMTDESGNTKFEIRQGSVTASIVSASGGLIGPLDGGTF